MDIAIEIDRILITQSQWQYLEYLVDSNGVILAIHPKAEELEKILGGILK